MLETGTYPQGEIPYSREQVRRILKKTESDKGEERRSIAERIQDHFKAKVAHALGALTEEERAQDKKIRGVLEKEIITPYIEPWDPLSLSNRIDTHQNLLLWYLVTSKELETATSDTFPPDQKLEQQVEIATQVLERNLGRNQEETYYQNKYTPSIGLEVEFAMSKKDPTKLIEARQRAGIPIGRESDQLHFIRKDLRNALYPSDYGSEYSEEKTIRELMFDPTASPKTQLRELLYLIKSGRLNAKEVVVHINVGGIELTKNRLEPLVLTALVAGAGYTAPLFSPGEIKSFESRKLTVAEAYPKTSVDHTAHIYYPFHKKKREVTKYKDTIDTTAVEYRGITTFDQFDNLVRATECMFWGSTAIKAAQEHKEIETPDETLDTLANIWDSVQERYEKLLQRHNITLGIENSINVWEGTKAPYNRALARIRYLSQTDPEFTAACREILRDCRAQVKKTLTSAEEKKHTD